jgi:hypothetical protein
LFKNSAFLPIPTLSCVLAFIANNINFLIMAEHALMITFKEFRNALPTLLETDDEVALLSVLLQPYKANCLLKNYQTFMDHHLI